MTYTTFIKQPEQYIVQKFKRMHHYDQKAVGIL